MYQIANGHRVLSALASQNGSGVELRPVKERDLYQEWRLKHIVGSWFEIQNVESGLLLDVSDVNYSNGAKLNVWEKAWSPNQVWSLEVQPK